MMSQIGESIADLAPPTPEGKSAVEMPELGVVETLVQFPTVNHPVKAALSDVDNSPPVVQSSGIQNIPAITAHDLSPPEVQRVVVEHIVKREDSTLQMQSSQRLCAFSGKVPRPAHEPDYDSW